MEKMKMALGVLLMIVSGICLNCNLKRDYIGTWMIKRFAIEPYRYKRPELYLLSTTVIIGDYGCYFPSFIDVEDGKYHSDGKFIIISHGERIYFETKNEIFNDTFYIVQDDELHLILANQKKYFELFKVAN